MTVVRPQWVENSLHELATCHGFTLHPDHGFYRGGGYSVSPYPERERRVYTKDATLEVMAEEIHMFSRMNIDLLAKPNHYLGAWHNSAGGDYVALDIAIITPSARDAERLRVINHQHDYYSFDLADTLPTSTDRKMA